MASTTSDLTDIGGAFQTTDLLYVAKDAGGGVFQDRKAAISRLDTRFQANLGFTPENVANKSTDGTLAANSDTLYASQKATKTYVDALVALNAAPYVDTQTIIKGSGDATKLLRFEVDGFTTATTRVLTPPNYDGTIATLNGVEALNNKSIGNITPGSGAFTTLSATGVTTVANGLVGAPGIRFANDADSGLWSSGAASVNIASNGLNVAVFNDGGVRFLSSLSFGWSSDPGITPPDLTLSREAAATLQMGVDAAAGVNQKFKAMDASGGTGGNLTLAAGTGTVAGGALILQTAATGTLADRVTVLANGNVGIGVTQPSFKFQVKTGTDQNLAMRPASDFSGSLDGVALQSLNDAGSQYRGIHLEGTQVTINSATGGNVGIGTTSPFFPLSFAGTLGAKINLYSLSSTLVAGFGMQSNLLEIIGQNSSLDYTFGYGTSGSLTRLMTVKGTGNVGIGTVSPAAKLDVRNAGNNVAYFYNTAASSASQGAGIQAFHDDGAALASGDRLGFLTFSGSTDGVGGVSTGSAIISFTTEAFGPSNQGSDLRFETTLTGAVGRATRLIINGSGNVGIGTTAPSDRLDIYSLGASTDSSLRFSYNDSSAAYHNRITNLFSGTASSHYMRFVLTSNSATVTPLSLTGAGNVGIGLTAPTAALHLKAGTATANTGPLKFTAGTLLTAPELGSVEYSDDATTGHLYGTVSVAGVPTRVQLDGGGGGSSPPFVDTTAIIMGSGDATKLLRFEVDGITTGTTRVLTAQDADLTIAGINLAQSFTALQTFNLGTDVISGQSYLYNALPILNAITALNDYFIGGAGNFTMTGEYNTAMGPSSLMSNTTGEFNVAIGFDTLRNASTADRNIALGSQAQRQNISGDDNTGIGNAALYNNGSGNKNTGIGSSALLAITNGSNNIGIGYQAGDNITTGSKNIVIGHDLNAPVATGSDQITIGNIIFATGASGTAGTIAGLVGIGQNTPTAALHLKAGTATASNGPLKFTAGTLLTVPELGSVEFTNDGTTGHLYVTLSVASVTTRVQLDSPAGIGLSGSGSPEGVVTANPGTTFWDTAGQSLWIKNTGVGTNTGFVQIVA